MKSFSILTVSLLVLLAVVLCSAAPKTRFLSNESKSRDTNEIDTSEDKSEKSSEENSKDTSKDNSEDTSENSSEETKEKHDDSDEKEPECGFDQCHYFQENQLKEDIESCGGCAEWFDSKFDNEKDRHN